MILPDGWVMCDHCGQAWRGGLQCSCWQATETPISSITADLTIVQDTADMGRKRKSKQASSTITLDGIQFDSKTEAQRYLVLKEAQQQKIISNLHCHPVYELQPQVRLPKNALRPKTVTLARRTYTPDFTYSYRGVHVVEDTKGLTQKKGKRGKYYRPLVSASARKSHVQLQAMRPDLTFLVSTPSSNKRDWWLWYSASNYVECKIQRALDSEEMVA